MALGFQDCCNGLNFFLLAETPASVSEFEVYSVETQEGPTFCATYVNLPTLNYQPPTYNAISLTQQLSCDDCIAIIPCPTEETIFHSQFGEGSVITTSDCTVTTIRQMQVQCFPTSPTYENSLDGELDLFINNGTPPYIITDYLTGQVINAPRIDDFYKVLTNISAGTYNFVVSDFTSDFSIPISCLVTAPPPLPVFECNTQDATFYEKPDGILDFIVLSAGTPPYRYYFGNSQFQFYPPQLIQGGTYNIRYEDQYYVQYITCTIGQPPEVIWPQKLCMSFDFCGTGFRLSFTRQLNPIKIDYRAWYVCDNPETIGVERLVLSYNEDNPGGWFIEESTLIGSPLFIEPCNIQLFGNSFSAVKSALTTDQPTGEYKLSGALGGGVGNVVEGPCGLSLSLLTVQDSTDGLNPNGKVIVQGQGGDGTTQYFLQGKDINLVSRDGIFENLPAGDYTVFAKDLSGNTSDIIRFTIGSRAATDFNRSFNTCVFADYDNFWLNQTPGGNSIQIEEGESRESYIRTTFSQLFDFLSEDSILSATLMLIVDKYAVTGPIGFDNPNLVASYTNNFSDFGGPINVTTDGVTYFILENSVPSETNFVLQQNGQWYKVSNGNSCCISPESDGLNWKNQTTWKSQGFIIKKNTSIYALLNQNIINQIPFTTSSQPGCNSASSCSGYIDVTLKAILNNIQILSGPVYISQSSKELFNYTFRTHSDGNAGWISSPTPSC